MNYVTTDLEMFDHLQDGPEIDVSILMAELDKDWF